MKMRELFDRNNGKGTWDRMYDSGLFEKVPIKVDGTMVSIFPGTDREVTVEKVEAEIRKALTVIAAGRATLINLKELDGD